MKLISTNIEEFIREDLSVEEMSFVIASTIVDQRIAMQMQRFFLREMGGSNVFKYAIEIGILRSILSSFPADIRGYSEYVFTPPPSKPTDVGYVLGVYAHIGKKAGRDDFQIVLEPVAFIQNKPGHIVYHKHDKRVPSANLKAYKLTNDSEVFDLIETKANLDLEVLDTDPIDRPYPVKIVFIDLQLLQQFVSDARTQEVRFFFIRNGEMARLSLMVSLYADPNHPDDHPISTTLVDSGKLQTSGFYFDQHDLIPPPPDEM